MNAGVLLLLLTLRAADAQCGKDSCTLDCNDHGLCCMGEANYSDYSTHVNLEGTPGYDDAYSFHQNTSINGMHCRCQVEYTDVNCETNYVYCDQTSTSKPCFHGGTCVEATLPSHGKEVHVCDCDAAVDEKGVHYVGIHCELAVSSRDDEAVDVCDDEGIAFCLNGGRCKSESSPLICECPSDWTGFHCEIQANRLENQNCNVQCQNGGACVWGFPRSGSGNEVDDLSHYQHCACPDGWAGSHCENPYTPCGKDKRCFYGSTCLPLGMSDANKFICDCAAAKNETHSFAGLGCEQTASTDFCSPSETLNGQHFCLNGGTCITEGNGIYNCLCTTNYHGTHCEFEKSKEPEIMNCTTACQNGGQCRKGLKDIGILKGKADIDHMINMTYIEETMEHCVCPTGFSGLLCEYKTEVCADGNHVCFHGAVCIYEDDKYKCDCGETDTAGLYCQHEATAFCDNNGDDGVRFCVNNGTCTDNGKCKCPYGYRGEQCEIKIHQKVVTPSTPNSAPSSYVDSPTKNNKFILISFGCVATIGCLSILLTVLITSKKTCKDPYSSSRDEHPVTRTPSASSEEDISSDEEDADPRELL